MRIPLANRLPTFAAPEFRFPALTGPALVMGSGPNFRIPEGYGPDWTLVTVNASQLLADKFGLPEPDIAVLRHGLLIHNSDQDIYKRELLQGRRTRHLVVPIWQGEEDVVKSGCRTFDYGFETFQALTKWQLANIIWRLCGTYPVTRGWHRKISTGAFAILLARFAGGSPVVVSGFSLSTSGHGYDSRNAFRYHADEDADLLARAAKRGLPIYAEDRDFASGSGIPLWRGQIS